MSTLTAFPFIGENSEATPGLWNNPFSIISANIQTLNSDVTLFLPVDSGDTFSLLSHLTVGGRVSVAERLHVSTTPSNSTNAIAVLGANSATSDLLLMADPSGAKASYLWSTRVGPAGVDGLKLYDLSGDTMIANFSKNSIRFFQNVVGPVFDVGGQLANTYNAAIFGTGADSIASRIQAAISQASIDGIARVYVPANMYPYSAASISFETRVQMVREGGDWSVYDIQAYGAGNSSITHDSAAAQAASNGAATGGLVKFPPGRWHVSGVTSYGFANFEGSGRSSVLYNTRSGTTTLTLRRHPTNQAYQNREGNLDGVSVRDVVFASNRNANVQGLWLERVDHSLFENLTFEAINGPAIHIAGACRENLFIGTITRWCAASANTGALLFDDASSDGGSPEGSNANYFYGTQLIYSHGPALQMMTSASSYSYLDSRIRKTVFIGYQFHGPVRNAPNWDSPAPFVDSALTHSLVSLRAVNEIMFLGGSVTGSGQSAAFFDIHNGLSSVTASGCSNIVIRDTAFGGHTATSEGTFTTVNSGVSIDGYCQVYLDNVDISNSPRDVVARSGSSLHLGFNCILNGTSSISSTAYEPANRLTGVFAPRPAEGLFILGATRLQTQTLREDTGANPLRIDSGQDSVANSLIIRTPDSGGSLSLADRMYFGSGSAVTAHILSRTSIDGLLRASGNITSRGNVIAAGAAPFFRLGSAEDGSQGQLGFSGSDTFWDYLGKLNIRSITGGYGNVFTVNPSGVPASQVLFGFSLSIVTGTSLAPGLALGSEASLGMYRSGASTMALSYGTFNLATGAVRLSMRTLAASAVTGSAVNTNVAINEVVFTIGGASGASLIVSSGGTAYIFGSVASAILA